MSKAKWLVLFLLALCMAVPTQAVELTLGGFPSYMRTRLRFMKNATFLSAMSPGQASLAGFNETASDDNVIFADTRLRLTPQLVLSDTVTIRAQVDVFDNNIWGGATANLLGGRSTVINSALTPNSRFRGACLVDPTGGNACVDDVQYFNVRMLHADVVLPGGLGFIRVGRQPFDWGMGILANGGWDPYSDMGFVLDRFLYLKSFPIGEGSFTFVFVTDYIANGDFVVGGDGDGYDIGAVALIYNHPNTMGGNLTLGVYDFPYIHQNNFGVGGSGSIETLSLDWFNLYAGIIDYKTDLFRLVAEVQGGFGQLSVGGVDLAKITAHNLLFAVRAEVYPSFPFKIVAAEFGYAGGNNTNTDVNAAGGEGSIEGNIIVFSPAYNLDNLLFKHMIPNIYQTASPLGVTRADSSVVNAFYARAWGTVKFLDSWSFTPQVLFAWNEQTTAPLFPGQNVPRFLGTELEGTLTWQVYPGVNIDLLGSFVISGSGLEELLEQQASNVVNTATDPPGTTTPGDFNAESYAYAVQGRLIVFIDQFFK